VERYVKATVISPADAPAMDKFSAVQTCFAVRPSLTMYCSVVSSVNKTSNSEGWTAKHV